MDKKAKNKGLNKLIITGVVVGIAVCAVLVFFKLKADKEKKVVDSAVNSYTKLLKKQDFSGFTKLFSTDSFNKYTTSQEEVSTRYQNIFSGIEARKIDVEELEKEKNEDDSYTVTYRLAIDTQYGKITTEQYKTVLNKNQESYQFAWTPALVFPGMTEKDTVNVKKDEAARGEIVDRNGSKLAENYNYQQLGVNPSKLGEGEQKQQEIQGISDQFDVSTEIINEKLAQGWAVGDVFVPVKTLENAISQQEIEALPQGAAMGSVTMRHYPLGESAAHLLGYVGKVTAEDIEKKPQISEGEYIGRSGLEAALDEQLRGKSGVDITIIGEDSTVKHTLLRVKKEEASTITLTVDSEAQRLAYDSLGGKPGTAVASEPKTGELLVATGAPSYNPNKMVLGISDADYKAYSENTDLPFMARFANRYAPGSTFKTITAAIGLDAGAINPSEERSIEGLKWQKDASWGGFWTTRVKDTPVVNLEKALVYSDNIYFAQKSLEMGEKTFRDGLNKFIFGEELDIPIYIEPATISNGDAFDSEILLADTAYGQGELMISPISQLSMYSIFMNEGSIVYPQIVKDQEVKMKKDVVSAGSANTILTDLIGSVTWEDGYVHSLYKPDFNLAAKTGTAEIKEKQDTLGTENSFLLFFDVDKKGFMGLIMSENSRENGTAVEKAPELVNYLEAHY